MIRRRNAWSRLGDDGPPDEGKRGRFQCHASVWIPWHTWPMQKSLFTARSMGFPSKSSIRSRRVVAGSAASAAKLAGAEIVCRPKQAPYRISAGERVSQGLDCPDER